MQMVWWSGNMEEKSLPNKCQMFGIGGTLAKK